MAYVSYSILSAASFLLVTWFISATPTVNAFLTSPLRRPPRAFTAAAAAKSRGGYDASTHVPGRGRDKATVRTMASRDEELESLRRENESLKEELWASSRRSKPPVEKGSFNPLKALGSSHLYFNFLLVPCLLWYCSKVPADLVMSVRRLLPALLSLLFCSPCPCGLVVLVVVVVLRLHLLSFLESYMARNRRIYCL